MIECLTIRFYIRLFTLNTEDYEITLNHIIMYRAHNEVCEFGNMFRMIG